MSDDQENQIDDNRFRVISIEKTTAPSGMPNGSWYRYIIGRGSRRIEGTRAGTLKSVKQHAEIFTENLNTRISNGYSAAYAARKQAK